jgi:hypothetical protein
MVGGFFFVDRQAEVADVEEPEPAGLTSSVETP